MPPHVYKGVMGLVQDAQVDLENKAAVRPQDMGGATARKHSFVYVPMAPAERPKKRSLCFWIKLIAALLLLAAIVGAGVHALILFDVFESEVEETGENLVRGFSRVAGELGEGVTGFISDAGHDVGKIAAGVAKAGSVVADHSEELLESTGTLLVDTMKIAKIGVDTVVAIEDIFLLSFWIVECTLRPDTCSENFESKYHLCAGAARLVDEGEGEFAEYFEPCQRNRGTNWYNGTYRDHRDTELLTTMHEGIKQETLSDREVLLRYVKKSGADRSNARLNGKNRACSTDLSPAALEDCSLRHCLLPGGVRGMRGALFVDCLLATTDAEWRVVLQIAEMESSHLEDVAMRNKGAHLAKGGGFPMNTPPPMRTRPPFVQNLIPDLSAVGGRV